MQIRCTWIEFQAVMGLFSLAGTSIFYSVGFGADEIAVIAALIVKNTKLGTTSVMIIEAVPETLFLATYPTVEKVKVSEVIT